MFVETLRHSFGVAPLPAAIGEAVSTFYDAPAESRRHRVGG
jgi:hypothetical protein